MSLLKTLGLALRPVRESEPEPPPIEPHVDHGEAVFQDAELFLDEFHHMRVVVTHVGPERVRVAYAPRMDLPFRVMLVAPGLKLKCWARVTSQDMGAAELAFEYEECCCEERP
jgi:hypothetical protein